VTRPRPDLPMVLLSHRGPVSFGRDESGRTANRGADGWSRPSSAPMPDLPDAVGYARCHRRDPAVVGEQTTRCSASPWSPSRGSSTRPSPPLRSASFHRSAAPGRGRPPGPGLLCRGPSRARGDSCTAGRWDRVAGVIDQQLRARARSSSRKLADLVGEVVVQEARRERVAALVMDDARVRVAEARAQAAKQAVQAGPNRADPTYRGPTTEPKTSWPHGASRRTERLAGGWRW
jgi:hypothetical protein